jgi:hypothetical protein
MALIRKKGADAPSAHSHMTKKCPDCFAYLRLDAKTCPSCGKSVGSVMPTGLAEKPVDLKAYILAIGAACTFIVFIWWGFFSESDNPFLDFRWLAGTAPGGSKSDSTCPEYPQLAERLGICPLEPIQGPSFRARVVNSRKMVWSSCKGTRNGDEYRFVNRGDGFWETDGGSPACPFYEGFYLGSQNYKDYQTSMKNQLTGK